MIPDKDDKPVPVLTDRHFLVDIMAKIEKENYAMIWNSKLKRKK